MPLPALALAGVNRANEPVRSADVDAAVEAWHSGAGDGLELHEYLGWSWEQYARWVDDGIAPDEEEADQG